MAMPSFRSREQVTGVVYYCKDCERIVDAHQIGRKYVYSCNICKTKNVAFGTEKSIRSYFHFDEGKEAPPAKVEAKAEIKVEVPVKEVVQVPGVPQVPPATN